MYKPIFARPRTKNEPNYPKPKLKWPRTQSPAKLGFQKTETLAYLPSAPLPPPTATNSIDTCKNDRKESMNTQQIVQNSKIQPKMHCKMAIKAKHYLCKFFGDRINNKKIKKQKKKVDLSLFSSMFLRFSYLFSSIFLFFIFFVYFLQLF